MHTELNNVHQGCNPVCDADIKEFRSSIQMLRIEHLVDVSSRDKFSKGEPAKVCKTDNVKTSNVTSYGL